MELFTIGYRTAIFYFFIVIAYRLMGKRELGQLSVIDLIVSILIAELAAISIENFNETMFYTFIPIIVLVILEILLAKISARFIKVRTIIGHLIDGKPSLIVKDGKINYREMTKLRYSIDDLLLQLRQNSIKSIDEVEYAFLEHNGKLSIFKYNYFKLKRPYPMPVIIEGKIQFET